MHWGNAARVVVTIHGIRTRGVWQKEITPHLANHGMVPHHIDYGWFGAISFFLPFFREHYVGRVRAELRTLVQRLRPQRRISVVAHSFGTHLAVEALMRERGNIRYDRLVLTGSIVPRDFPWQQVLNDGWVAAVRNERAGGDWVVSLAAFVARRLHWISWLKAGDSGRHPFTESHPALLEYEIDGDHSEAHNDLKYERWARFVSYPYLPQDLLDCVRQQLGVFRLHAARILDVNAEHVRLNLFAPVQNELRIIPGATENMDYVPELDLRIALGHGATGTAFRERSPCWVVRAESTWSGHDLPPTELAKLHPRLRWVVSFPIVSASRKEVVAVLNVDGLDSAPAVFQNNSGVLAVVVALHLHFSAGLQACLEAAFSGEDMPELVR